MECNSLETGPHIYENLHYNTTGIIDHEQRIDFSGNDILLQCLIYLQNQKRNWIPTLNHIHRNQFQMN